jgi:hypothetical protein
MKRSLPLVFLIGMLAVPCGAQAQQFQDFEHHEVHFNALNTTVIPPEMAQAYGIQRSSNRGLLTVTVLRKVTDADRAPEHAVVKASSINLTGQRRKIKMREVSDATGEVYYLGELPVYNLELHNFTLEVKVEGEDEPLIVEFRQQFYTE